tara:strand:- start:102884 stop:103417 length:534 start_codon:yes stop_codon:yes gene_type:complete
MGTRGVADRRQNVHTNAPAECRDAARNKTVPSDRLGVTAAQGPRHLGAIQRCFGRSNTAGRLRAATPSRKRFLMQKVFITYRLAPGVSMDAYKEWSRTVDQRITPFQDSIDGFVPWQILGGEPDDTGVDIIEEITIEDWDAYQKMQKESSEMAVVLEGFERLVDQSTVRVYYGNRVK